MAKAEVSSCLPLIWELPTQDMFVTPAPAKAEPVGPVGKAVFPARGSFVLAGAASLGLAVISAACNKCLCYFCYF